MKTLIKFIKANLIFFLGCIFGSVISSIVFGVYLRVTLNPDQINEIQVIRECLLE